MTADCLQVRRCGALGCVRLFDHAPEAVLECGLTDALYDGLRDSDPIAITNCILALDHILQTEGGIVVNKNIAHYLLGRIMQFSECNAVYVLTILLRSVHTNYCTLLLNNCSLSTSFLD